VDLVIYLVLLALWGLVVGLFARLALPGPDPLSLLQTSLVGVGGSLIAFVVSLVLFGGQIGGFLMCLVFSVAILYFIRRSRGGGLTSPGAPGR
jgi:uncharacterized membrane protein YeaQ/YmgE (transglycosylase-associated protein family)